MFTQLALLLQNCTSLQVIMAANPDGTLALTVLPKGKSGDKDAALNTPLGITATPDELNEGFVAALTRYVNTHQSLAEQIANTETILEAAKAESQKKATKAISKKTEPQGTSSEAHEDDEDENQDTQGNDSTSGKNNETSTPAASSADSLWD